eukprot:TRINITY_DN3088_c0_g1_i4.p1 TRINITY_DN3088_c0_g1~~TRINITY_DN3088_c0_g1_i4.p1  ORF type:complete len:850 (+),score=160.46 TRINITY_DN3088_c0_g1_i4:453-3002(+)
MDHSRAASGNIDENVGIPEDLRCKRTDGKQWRCNALSMPDKTVCEKHYIQAKKRAANSALRASLKKAKTKPTSENNVYLDSKNDDLDMNVKDAEFSTALPGRKHKEKSSKNPPLYSPETVSVRTLSTRTPKKSNEDPQRDTAFFDENRTRSASKTPPSPADSIKNRTQRKFSGFGVREHSYRSTDSSGDADEQTCHQCQRSDQDNVIWCRRCDRRGYCESCIYKWYPDIPLEEIRRACPVCCGTCNCRVCLNGDNLIKLRIQEMAGIDKLQCLHHLLSLVRPVLKRIHSDQSFELELETRVHGVKSDIPRANLRSDEQMCCDCCKVPIIDYHWHCAVCLYDLCLTCCRDLRHASLVSIRESEKGQFVERSQDRAIVTEKTTGTTLGGEHVTDGINKSNPCLSHLFLNWKANSDGSIPCPPKESGGCGCPSLDLRRIFKMNWVAKLVKNAEELVSGCKVHDVDRFPTCVSCMGTMASQSSVLSDSNLILSSHREDSNDNILYCAASQDIKREGICHFQKHWERGEPAVVKHVFDLTSTSFWDPMVIWREMWETTDETMKDDKRLAKAIDCLDGSEVDIGLGQFIKGYSEGRIHQNGWPAMLKLKDWPPPNALEEFLLYQRPEFVSKLPLLEYIHSKWGLLNLSSKLPHDSLQNDAGPKLYIGYGTYEEMGRGDSVTELNIKMGDTVYVLMHTSEVKFQGWQRAKMEKIQRSFTESDAKESVGNTHMVEAEMSLDERKSPDLSPNEHSKQNGFSLELNLEDEIMEDQMCNGKEITSGEESKDGTCQLEKESEDVLPEKAHAGALWDVFRRQDVPKLNEYVKVHWNEFKNGLCLPDDSVSLLPSPFMHLFPI